MKKWLWVILVVMLLCFSWNPLNWFASYPEISATQANPLKVKPGEILTNYVQFEDKYQIEKVIAYFPFEGGEDKIQMTLVEGNEKKGIYKGEWKVHDTLNFKWYKTKVELKNIKGKTSIIFIDWQDPTPPPQRHSLSELMPGTIGIDDATAYDGRDQYNFTRNNSVLDGNFFNITVENGTALRGESEDANGIGVYGFKNTTNTLISAVGVKGHSESVDGIGVYGHATYSASASENNYGVKGEIDGTNDEITGVYGLATYNGATATGVGVMGVSNAGKGIGIKAHASTITSNGPNYGIKGETMSTTTGACGIYGKGRVGVYGESNSGTGYGVAGRGNRGVYGYSTTGNAVNGTITSTGQGVYGYASSSTGSSAIGVYGDSSSTSYNGVYAKSDTASESNPAIYVAGYENISGHTIDNCRTIVSVTSSGYGTVNMPDSCMDSNCKIIAYRYFDGSPLLDMATYFQESTDNISSWIGSSYTDGSNGRQNGASSGVIIVEVTGCTLYLDHGSGETAGNRWTYYSASTATCSITICQ